MVQILLGVITALAVAIAVFILYKVRAGATGPSDSYKQMTLESLVADIKVEVAEFVRDDNTVKATDVEFDQIVNRRRHGEMALTMDKYGDETSRRTVIGLYRDVIERRVKSIEEANQIVGFDMIDDLSDNYKWEILLYRLEKVHGLKVIQYLEKTYHISEKRLVEDGLNTAPRRVFDRTMLRRIVRQEIVEPLNFAECLDMLAIFAHNMLGPFGCITTLRRQYIDGFNFGTSGSIRYELDGNFMAPYKTTNSVWVQYDAKWVHFSFIDFVTQGEMKRVITQLTAWGTNAPMTQNAPTKVTDDIAGNRVTAVRPPAGECWAVFFRKPSVSLHTLSELLDKGDNTKNWEMVKKLIFFLIKSERTIAFTGQQNTGKTTLLKAAMEYCDCVNVRILEMAFELALRELYPTKNIMTVKPTEFCSSSWLQDLLKKTDGYLSMVGEVAEDIVAARMIQFCLVASAFTMFSHHGKNDPSLINGLTNSLVASGEYRDHAVAMSTVLDVINHNVHLDFKNDLRVVAYISEIVKENEVAPYPEIRDLMLQANRALRHENAGALAKVWLAYTSLTREYYTRVTDRIRFTNRNIIEYDDVKRIYVPKQWYTDETEAHMLKTMPIELRPEFLAFKKQYWG